MLTEKDLVEDLVTSLKGTKYEIVREPKGRSRPDLILRTPEGEIYVIEVKARPSPLDSVDVAQVLVMKKEFKADKAFLVSATTATGSASLSAEKASVQIVNPSELKKYLGLS